MATPQTPLAKVAGFEILGLGLGSDLRAAIREALAGRVVFEPSGGPLAIFRSALAASIRDIEAHDRGQLLQRFLLKGPYEDVGEIPAALAPHRLSDEDTAAAVAFVHSFMVKAFKGAVAELLSCRSCLRVVRDLQAQGLLPSDARIFAGDTVLAPTLRSSRFAKGADLHVLSIGRGGLASAFVDFLGAVEVKSYPCSQRRIRAQLHRHLRRGCRGLRILGEEIQGRRVRLGGEGHQDPLMIAVVPARWRLPRTVAFETGKGGRTLRPADPQPPTREDRIERLSEAEWRITLRWSEEALASAAYEMTFWYMAKVGEVLYREGVPREWAEMGPEEAGQNAVKMALNYAILRARTLGEEQRAIALYNTYGFGYALGMSFQNQEGRREMLWPEDLDEIARKGVTRHGCRLHGASRL
jgi:hypothetical protein